MHCLSQLPRLRWFTLVFAALALATLPRPVSAQPGEDEPAEVTDRTIYVPFKHLQDILGDDAATAIVPYQDYLRYLEGVVSAAADRMPADAIITRSEYTATIEEDLARIKAVYAVNVLGQPWVELPLAFGDAAVGKLDTESDNVFLRGTGEGAYALLLGEEGEQTITLELIARVRTSPDGREFSLTVPPVGITTFEVTVPEAQQDVKLTPQLVALPVEGAADDVTTMKANLGATKSITARWHPKASLKPEMELLASVTNRQLVTIEGGYVHHDAWLTYDVLRGTLQTLQIAAPLGQRILDVSGDVGVKSWKAEDEANRQLVTIELISPVESSVTIEVHTEREQGDAADPVSGIGDEGTVSGIHAVDAVRESGQVAVRVGDGLELTVAEQQGVTRISADEVDGHLKPGAATAFKFYAPEFQLAVTAKPIEPRVLATNNSQLVFDDDELRLIASLAYQVERAGIFELKLNVPDNLVIDDVQSPQRQDDSFDEDARILTVKLQQSTQGAVGLTVRAHRPFEAGKDETEQNLPILEPLDVDRETGSVLVFAPPGIEVVTNSDAVQSAQPAPGVGGRAHGQAQLQSAWNYTRRPVRIPVTTNRKPTRLSATIATAIDVQPETIEVTTLLDYHVDFAGVDTFQFLVPEGVSEGLQIEAVSTSSGSAEIKQKVPGEAADGWVPWTVVMQRKIVGSQGLRITYRLTGDAAGDEVDVDAADDADADADGAGEEQTAILVIRPQGKPETADGSAAVELTQLKGEVRVVKERSLSVTSDASGGDVEPIDVRELTLLPAEGALAYRYFRQPDDGAVEVTLTQTKHDIQEVTPTVVQNGLVEVAAQSESSTFRCRYLIKTTERQRLRIDLPKELELLGVFIDGAEEKLNPVEGAEEREDVAAYTVNISRRKRSEEAFVLTLQFNWNVNPAPFESPFGRGEITFPLPRVGGTSSPAPVQQLQTVVYVPQRFWLVGKPERFTILGERDWWDGLSGNPSPYRVAPQADFGNAVVTPLDFPTEGLVPTLYQNLGGAGEINVVWWDTVKMTVLFSVALALMAFILLKTSWENRLGLLLLIAFVALLFGTKDRDALAHGLAAARIGLLFLVGLWVVHGLLSRRPQATPAMAGGAPVPTPEPAAPAESSSPPPDEKPSEGE